MEFIRVIGLVGHRASGKDTLCEYLAQAKFAGGFTMYAIGATVVHEAKRSGMENPTTSQLQDFAAVARRKSGDAAYWSKRTLELAAEKQSPLVIINGIRNPMEIDAFQTLLGEKFVLMGLTAPTTMRYGRAKSRARAGDALSLEDFLRIDDRDRGVGEPMDGFHSDRCMARVPLAHVRNNADTLDDFHAWADHFMQEVLKI